MSSKIVSNEIKRFLSDKEPEVLCIQGKWGVGKTFAWKQYFKEAKENAGLAMNRYAYVSLFGINNLNDLKQSIFENTYEKDLEENVGLNPTLTQGLNFLKKTLLRSGIFSKHIDGLDRLAFLLVRNQIVCIDDLERAGTDLSINDILGLVSFLKTERNCKVVILMNNEELSEESGRIFEKQKEKVTDIVVTFEPTAVEAADIVFTAPNGVQETIQKNCVLLGITNIRVIKKIERNCYRILEILEKYPDLHFQAIHSTTLFTWSTLQPKEAPPLDFIKSFRQFHLFGDDKKNMSEEQKTWGSLLSSYNFFHVDELDLLIINGIKRGYFSGVEFDEIVAKSNEAAIRNKQENSISKAWDSYHGSFKDNEGEVLDNIYTANLGNLDVLSPANLHSAIRLLKEFERVEQATGLLDAYVKARENEKEIFDLNKHSFFRDDITDTEMIDAFNKKFATFVDARDPVQLLEDIVRNHGWNTEDIELLKKLTVDDFYNIFKQAEGDQLHRVVRGALEFLRIQGIEEETRAISLTASEALKRIGKENRLNKRRVSNYGVKIDEDVEKPKA